MLKYLYLIKFSQTSPMFMDCGKFSCTALTQISRKAALNPDFGAENFTLCYTLLQKFCTVLHNVRENSTYCAWTAANEFSTAPFFPSKNVETITKCKLPFSFHALCAILVLYYIYYVLYKYKRK